MRTSHDLDKATDRLTEALAQIERVLAERRYGVEAQVSLGLLPTGGEPRLAFRKEGTHWRLLVERDGSEHPSLLINASRAARIAAVARIPALVEALVDAVTAQLTEVISAADAAETLLAALRPADGGQ